MLVVLCKNIFIIVEVLGPLCALNHKSLDTQLCIALSRIEISVLIVQSFSVFAQITKEGGCALSMHTQSAVLCFRITNKLIRPPLTIQKNHSSRVMRHTNS